MVIELNIINNIMAISKPNYWSWCGFNFDYYELKVKLIISSLIFNIWKKYFNKKDRKNK
jgi:hypothetical protein